MHMIKPRLKTGINKYGNQTKFLYKSQSKRWFRNEIQSLLKGADARESAYHIWRISLLCGPACSCWRRKV